MHVFAYRWVDYQDNLMEIPQMWKGGMSSYGGFVGAGLAGTFYLIRNRVAFMKYADVALYGFIPGWTIGRIGCFAIHDHPGVKSDFFLATEMLTLNLQTGMPEIAARHDLGLYDGFLTLFIWGFLVWGAKTKRFDGWYLGWSCVLYAIPRFFLDYLRATDLAVSDTRYAGLTPAQYGSIVLLAIGGWVLWTRRNTSSETPVIS